MNKAPVSIWVVSKIQSTFCTTTYLFTFSQCLIDHAVSSFPRTGLFSTHRSIICRALLIFLLRVCKVISHYSLRMCLFIRWGERGTAEEMKKRKKITGGFKISGIYLISRLTSFSTKEEHD